MKVVKINNVYNYKKDDGTYLLDEHVYWCDTFKEGFGVVQYKDYAYKPNTYNFVNSEGKQLLKQNVKFCGNFNRGFAQVKINLYWYYIDKECNFYKVYNNDIVSFKELYNEFPNMRSELIEIIEKYTYHDINEYFNI